MKLIGRGLSFGLIAGFLHATLAVVPDLRTLAHESPIVVEAEVLKQSTYQDSQGRIITLSTLKVKDPIKGARLGEELTIYQVMNLQGASVYKPGEQIVFFGFPHRDKVVSYGLGLGKFNIVKTHHGPEVFEEIKGLEVLNKKSGIVFYEEVKPRRYISLDDFKDAIKSAL